MDQASILILIGFLQIIVIDLILGIDNALVIALAVKNLKGDAKKRATFLGMFLAVAIRAVFVFIFLFLGEKELPLFYLLGGILLVKIGWDLMSHSNNDDHKVTAQATLWGAIKTIVIADAIMSIDNALAISQIAANSTDVIAIEMAMVIFGLLITVPIILYGAKLVGNLIQKNPWIIYLGAFLIIHVAGEMIVEEQFIHNILTENLSKSIPIIISIFVVGLKIILDNKKNK